MPAATPDDDALCGGAEADEWDGEQPVGASLSAGHAAADGSGAPDAALAAGLPPQALRAKLWRAVAERKRSLRPKEMREACAFYDAIRKDARRSAPELVVDVCGGHGALGMLFVAHGVAARALIIDQCKPASHRAVLDSWRPFFGGEPGAAAPVVYDERPLQEALPQALAANHGSPVLVVACHACQYLARDVLDCCAAARVDFAVCPCCPKDVRGGTMTAAARALGVDFGAAMVLAEMGRLGELCAVHLRTFDAEVSPHNRILVGRFDGAQYPGDHEGRAERLRRAYRRAHRQADPAGQAECQATLGDTAPIAPEGGPGADYEAQLERKVQVVTKLLRPLLGDEAPALETRRSPPRHFRARTVVAVGASPGAAADDGEGTGGLYRLIQDAAAPSGWRLAANLDVETLLEPVAAALRALPTLLGDAPPSGAAEIQRNLRCIKLHSTVGGSPRQLLACLVYGPGYCCRCVRTLQLLRVSLQEAVAAAGIVVDVVVMMQARDVQLCAPEHTNFVDEVLQIDGRHVRYRQPFGAFSNPNPHIAVATAEWLLDVIRREVNEGGEPSTDLLELYCGAGSHTVALAPLFRHVLAVEIDRRLVDAAKHNVAVNGLPNVSVLRAPSGDFCKRLLRRGTYELRGSAAPRGLERLELRFGCTVVDPPRAGLDAVTRAAVRGYGHLLYVSCNPEALHRDLQDLLETHAVARTVVLDHFPFSAHVETAVYLRHRQLPGASE